MAAIVDSLDTQSLIKATALVLALLFVSHFFHVLADGFPYWHIPLVGRSRWELSNTKAKARFLESAKELISEGFREGRKVFQLTFTHDTVIVLHPCFIDEIKNNSNLSFSLVTKKLFFGEKISGFEPFGGGNEKYDVVREVINKKLTYQVLGKLVLPLSRETAFELKESFPESDDWQEVTFGFKLPYIISRLSSLVFMGDAICRDKNWQNVSVNYAIDAFQAARTLRYWPAILRPVVHWFLPCMQKIRRHVSAASSIIKQEIDRRDMIRDGKLPAGPPRTHEDALDWLPEVARGRPFSFMRSQIGLSLASIHTTSKFVLNVLYDLITYSENLPHLRDEIKAVVEEDGILTKSSLMKLKKLDSFMKESQRLSPLSLSVLNRVATEDVHLSDGTLIPKGATITVSTHSMQDEAVYPNAKTFDGLRFWKMRQIPGNETRYQLASTSAEHYGFGHGMHACTGRFFATTEIKILLVHLLMKYDWKFADQTDRPKPIVRGMEVICDPRVKVLYRAREPEIDLRKLGEEFESSDGSCSSGGSFDIVE
ncbi:cytochrome P450 [Aspergillus steynii IBT 23096]|uniref:Cytochrome P450 n=1 Tax=Aspergillus steynii IBT 23096 TaxID=1392250 RepID=A0A2I2GRB3_9EURO|nr:cytochrome P450 [Aspergillus steynii IBT 23096]PLB55417.1 cytochrome P450 [Aspergillus steynii IBT 23096]